MQQDTTKEKHLKKKKVRTWAEAAKIVLELNSRTPMGHKEILRVIKQKNLKEISGAAPLSCLNSMLHAQSKGNNPQFYKVAGRMGVYGLKSQIPEGATMLEMEEECGIEDSVDEDGEPMEPALKSGKEKTKEKVLYVKLPHGYKTVPPESNLLPNNGAVSESVITSSQEPPPGAKEKAKPTNPNVVPPLTLSLSKAFQNSSAPTASILSSSAISSSPAKVSQTHSKRAIKHALKQQQKRRRKNTSIAASGTSAGLIPRIIMKPLLPPPALETRLTNSLTPSTSNSTRSHYAATITSSCGSTRSATARGESPKTFSNSLAMKTRKRSLRKLTSESAWSKYDDTRSGSIDIETPQSILVNTNLRDLLSKQALASLSPACQQRLIQLMPEVDRHVGPDNSLRLCSSALNNEFFARACQQWCGRLAKGEFVPENQVKLKAEQEKTQGKVDPWKIKHFEPIWGQKTVWRNQDSPVPEDDHSPSKPSCVTAAPPSAAAASGRRATSICRPPRLVVPLLKLRSCSETLRSAEESGKENDNKAVAEHPNKRPSVAVTSSDDAKNESKKSKPEINLTEKPVLAPVETVSANPLSLPEEAPSDGISAGTDSVNLPNDDADAADLDNRGQDRPETPTPPVCETPPTSSTPPLGDPTPPSAVFPNDGTPQPSCLPPPQCSTPPPTLPVPESPTSNAGEVNVTPPSPVLAPPVTQAVPPIRICTTPTSRPYISRKLNADYVNLERSYQICQQVLLSSQNYKSRLKAKPTVPAAAIPGTVNGTMVSTDATLSSVSSGRAQSLSVVFPPSSQSPALLVGRASPPQAVQGCDSANPAGFVWQIAQGAGEMSGSGSPLLALKPALAPRAGYGTLLQTRPTANPANIVLRLAPRADTTSSSPPKIPRVDFGAPDPRQPTNIVLRLAPGAAKLAGGESPDVGKSLFLTGTTSAAAIVTAVPTNVVWHIAAAGATRLTNDGTRAVLAPRSRLCNGMPAPGYTQPDAGGPVRDNYGPSTVPIYTFASKVPRAPGAPTTTSSPPVSAASASYVSGMTLPSSSVFSQLTGGRLLFQQANSNAAWGLAGNSAGTFPAHLPPANHQVLLQQDGIDRATALTRTQTAGLLGEQGAGGSETPPEMPKFFGPSPDKVDAFSGGTPRPPSCSSSTSISSLGSLDSLLSNASSHGTTAGSAVRQQQVSQYLLTLPNSGQQQYVLVSSHNPLAAVLPKQQPPRASSAPPQTLPKTQANLVRSSSLNCELTPGAENPKPAEAPTRGSNLMMPTTVLVPANGTYVSGSNFFVPHAGGATVLQGMTQLPLVSVGVPQANAPVAVPSTMALTGSGLVQSTVLTGGAILGPPANCVCNLKAMIACKKCGAFCHDDCIGPMKLCVTCLIR